MYMKLFSSRSLRQRESRWPLLLSFLLPFLICGLGFTVVSRLATGRGLYPFGDSMILAHDGWHQYYPFLREYREKLLTGGSLQYTWQVGMGTGYISLFAYYLSSPLNLLSIFVPEGWLTEFFAFLTILKISFAGLFFAFFLKKTYGRNDKFLPFFALAYALCAWTCGYYWNLMWLDAFALLPLLVAATVCLLRRGRYVMYICVLALTLWSNYYVAFFCCIFVLLCFFGYCIVCWNGFGNFLRRFVRIGVATLIGVGLTAVLLVPTMQAMQTTYSATAKEVRLLALNMAEGAYGATSEGQNLLQLFQEETLPGFLSAARQVLSNLLPVPEVTKMSGLPNVYCGFVTALLAIYYFFCRKIKLREKICNLLLLLFLLASFIFRVLDYIWHGFHFPNMLPYRFSFLFSFVLIAMAYRAWTLMDKGRLWHLAVLLPLGGLLIVNLWGLEEATALRALLSVLLLVLMALIFVLHHAGGKARKAGSVLLCIALAGESISCFALGGSKIGYTTRSSYPKESDHVQALLQWAEENTDDLFWRTEVTATQTLNDGALNGYNGASIFTSSANVNFNRFSRSLGFSSWPGSNRFSYYEGTPFTNTMSGIRYLIDRNGEHHDTTYTSLVATSGDVNLLSCDSYISLGFMTNAMLADFTRVENNTNPIDEQSEMFYLATGVEGDLYRPIYHSGLSAEEGCSLSASKSTATRFTYSTMDATEKTELSIEYTAPTRGVYCATTNLTNAEEVKVYINDQYAFTRNIKARSLFSLGSLQGGDVVSLRYSVEAGKSGSVSLSVAMLNQKVFDKGMETLRDEPWVLTSVSDTCLTGTVTALEDGLFYTSIPYEPGWTATVDGKPVALAENYNAKNEDIRLTDAVIAFPLTAGEHKIVLTYTTPGLKIGAIISCLSLVALLLLLLLTRRTGKLLPDRIPKRIPAPEPPAEPEEPPLLTQEEGAHQPGEKADKATLRKLISARKRSLTPEQIQAASEDLAQQLFHHPLYQNADAIYAYLSYNQEVRTEPILRRALAEGKRVAVPKIVEDEMVFLWVTGESAIARGYKGIPEPVDGVRADAPDALVLMPGLAFTPEGLRMGYGGGFYDRFLAAEPQHPTLALCYEFQLLSTLPVAAHDIPVDAVLSAEIRED